MSGNEFERAVHQMNFFCRRADVQGRVRMSITFDEPSDRARFRMELLRELSPNWPDRNRNLAGDDEYHLDKVTIRII